MKNKNILFFAAALLVSLSGCKWFHKTSERETILHKVVNIPKELILDIPYLPPLCDEIPGLKKGFADIYKGKLYYEEEEQGIPLVLINGGPGCTHQVFHPYFSQAKDFARIIYYDQRGTGKSSKDDTGETYTIKQAVEDLESLRRALKIDKWALLGHSYGGLLAQCYALTYPQNCVGLILVAATTGIPFEDNREREHMIISQKEWDVIENIGKMGSEGKFATGAQVIYNKLLAGDWKRSYYHKPTMEEIIRKALYSWSPVSGFEERMRPESDKINLQGKFDDFEIQTLIMEGKWDLLWWDPNRVAAMRKNHPRAQVEIFEKSGHMIFVDEPEKFFSLLRRFLESKKLLPIK